MTDLEKAKSILNEQNCSVVLCKQGDIITKNGRGISPLLELIAEGKELSSFSAADRIVGKAAAMLFSYMNVTAVYGEVMSRAGYEYLASKKITAKYGTLCENIINRKGDDICPMEKAVKNITDQTEAFEALKRRRDELMSQKQ